MEMRRAAYCHVWLLLLVVAALAVSLAAAHQPPRQVKGTPSPAAKSSSPPPASRAKGAGRARSAYDEDEEQEGFGKEADDETARARVVRKTSSPPDLTAVNQPKGASSGLSDADLAKERSAPLSGVVLQYQRQLEKERREKGKASKGATEGVHRFDPAAGQSELPTSPKHQVYEQALELFNRAKLDTDAAALSRALSLFYEAARAGNEYALFTLAELHEFGEVEHVPRNLTAAVYYHNASASRGNPTAQKSLAFFYDTGKEVPVNRALAFLYYDFAAQGGEVEAQITMGYKHLFGHGTRKDCGRAADYYGTVAQLIAEEVAASGLRYGTETHRLVNNDDAVSYTEEEDVVQYWKYSAETGDPSAQVTMGTLHLQGAYGVEQNYELAREYFALAAEQGDLGGLTNMGFLYAKGYGVEQNNKTAFQYLQQAASQNHPYAQALLGYMYLHGMGVERNVKEAVNYFWKSAEQGNSDGILHLANCYFYGEGVTQDYGKALQYYLAATEGGNLVAHFNLAQMHRFGVGANRNCHVGVSLYKKLVERGPINDLLAEAYALYEEGDVDAALYRYELAAEMGVEIAQSNAAWLYDHGFGEGDDAFKRQKAFDYYGMAAEQKNPLAHQKMGDFYYYGLGTQVDQSKAAAYYRAASDLRDAQATFNLGYMHQHGIGLPQDLHLAKRFYDLAYEINPDAYVAWALALASIGAHLAVDYLLRGDASFLFGFNVDVETFALVGLSVLLVFAVVARQYVVLVQEERRRRRTLHPHQD